MDASFVEKFIEQITTGKETHDERFYEIFTARGFLLESDGSSGRIRLSDNSHTDDSEFLEMLQNINYKTIYNKPHQDSIREDILRDSRVCFDHVNTQLYDINNPGYLAEVFTQEIPVDIFRLNWERDWYGKFNQFREVEHIPKIRVYDLEPFIARLVKSVSSVGISTWSSCEGHLDKPPFIVFDGRYHCAWCQVIFNNFVQKRLDLVCRWEWLEDRCYISSPGGKQFELYVEIQEVARLIYDYRIYLRNIKRQVGSRLTDKHKNMNQGELLNAFGGYFEESITKTNQSFK